MIRNGKAGGWLSLPDSALMSAGPNHATFASMFGVNTDMAKISRMPGKGAALLARSDIPVDTTIPILLVPQDLVLSRENAMTLSKTDKQLREVLEATGRGDLTSTRQIILLVLLVQATHSCPTVTESVGIQNPFSDYIKFLPMELLPSLWNEQEIGLLSGTTLKPAIEAKIASLYREFEELRKLTASIEWCQQHWWDEVDGLLSFEDWKNVDAMYRSRALEFPGIGDCMIPCLDICNHASRSATVARYEADQDGNALLILRDGRSLRADEEITITYGDDKGACEMLFSYGFIETGLEHAGTMLLDLEIPADDPLARAKKHAATCAPGLRITLQSQGFMWESDYIWLVIINEEDGLDFELLQTVDGSQELRTLIRETVISDSSQVKAELQRQDMWPVYRLRAVSLVQARVTEQLDDLLSYHDDGNRSHATSPATTGQEPLMLARRLRDLERGLLEIAGEHLETEAAMLLENPMVQDYMAKMNAPAVEEVEDFS